MTFPAGIKYLSGFDDRISFLQNQQNLKQNLLFNIKFNDYEIKKFIVDGFGINRIYRL